MLSLTLFILAVQLGAPVLCRYSQPSLMASKLASQPFEVEARPGDGVVESTPKRTYFVKDAHVYNPINLFGDKQSPEWRRRTLEEIQQDYKAIKMDLKEKVDGFNHDICGKAQTYEWQLGQHAYGCAGVNGPLNIEPPGEIFVGRQFAAHVFLEVERGFFSFKDVCAGTLIHRNLVLTTNSCLRGAKRVTVKLGVDRIDDPMAIEVAGKSWCVMPEFEREPQLDAAILKLKRKVVYIEKMIQPACLMPERQINPTALCGFRGASGPRAGRMFNSVTDGTCRLNENFTTCFETGPVQKACWAHAGSGVYCTDTCSTYGNFQQLYLVAVTQAGQDYHCEGEGKAQIRALDVHRARSNLEIMIMFMLMGDAKHRQYCTRLDE